MTTSGREVQEPEPRGATPIDLSGEAPELSTLDNRRQLGGGYATAFGQPTRTADAPADLDATIRVADFVVSVIENSLAVLHRA